ncbi:MAG: hypothetical protein IPQ06_00190 [Chitinophagaceae bacterium]|nr:hypothetical protein [Chitinophagaceae bacterium]
MKSSIFFLSFIILVQSCKKQAADVPAATEYPEFSFTYNGQTYSGMNNCELLMDNGSRLEGIGINKEDVFGGKIFFYSQAFNPSAPFNNCAFLQPTGTLIVKNLPGCLLTNFNGSPIDSSRVFIYNSGSISTAYTNCKLKTDPFTNIQYEECRVTGSFSLVIGNNSGQTKKITGSFKFLNIRK